MDLDWQGWESRTERPPSRRVFFIRVLSCALISALILGAYVAVGMWYFMEFGHLSLVEAFINVTILIEDAGRNLVLTNRSCQLFASWYVLLSTPVELISEAILLMPVLHRILHRFHLDLEEDIVTPSPITKPRLREIVRYGHPRSTNGHYDPRHHEGRAHRQTTPPQE